MRHTNEVEVVAVLVLVVVIIVVVIVLVLREITSRTRALKSASAKCSNAAI